MHARRGATAAAAALLVLAGCSVPEPSEWTYHHAALLRPADDLHAIGDAWRESLAQGKVRANIPADAACYFHLEGGEVQDDVVCGPTRRAGYSATLWQRATITSFYQQGGEVALTLGGDGSFRDVDPRTVGALRAADGSEPDLTVTLGPPEGAELAAGESVEVDPRPRKANGHTAYGGCVLTSSALCIIDTTGDGGRRMLGLAGREVLVVFQDVDAAGYGAEPFDPAPGTRMMAVTIINTRAKDEPTRGGSDGAGASDGGSDGGAGGGSDGASDGGPDDGAEGGSDDGADGSAPGSDDGSDGGGRLVPPTVADLGSILPVGTDGALGGAQDGALTASLAVGDDDPQGLGDLPEATVSAPEVFERLSSDAQPPSDDARPAGTVVRLVAVPRGESVVVTVSDGTYEADFRSDEKPSSTTVPADQQDFFSVLDPYGDTLPGSIPLGVDGTLDLGGRTQEGTMPVAIRADLLYLAADDGEVLGTDDDGCPQPISYRPEGGERAAYVPSVEIRDARLEVGGTTVPLEVAADDHGAQAHAEGTADISDLPAAEPADGADGKDAEDQDAPRADLRLRADVVLHLDLAASQDGELPDDQPDHLEWTQAVDESPELSGAPGNASIDGW